jgi:hypothetical protein
MDPVGAVPTITPVKPEVATTVQYEADERKNCALDRMWCSGSSGAASFQDSYVSKNGPRSGSMLPPDHPRRNLNSESSVTPEVDMSDFHEVEDA